MLSENIRAWAVGTFFARINSFAKILDDSRRAADLVGPKTRNLSAAKRSTIPIASGSSGPTRVSSTSFCFANRSSGGKSVAETAMFSAISAVPAFPGAQKIRSIDDDCFSFQTNACSRPPPPITRIFIDEAKESVISTKTSSRIVAADVLIGRRHISCRQRRRQLQLSEKQATRFSV